MDNGSNENRVTKWTKYLNKHEDKLKDFQNFWHPNKVDVNHVVAELKEFHKWLSEPEMIDYGLTHFDDIGWNCHTLTPVRHKIAEYMCKGLSIKYTIFDYKI